MKAGEAKYERYDVENITVRIYQDTAVLTGTAKVKNRYKGSDNDNVDHYMRIYVRRQDSWVPITTQWGRGHR